MRITSMLLLGLALACAPAFASNVVYSNGPINGTINAWNISSGFAVADGFDIFTTTTITGFDVGLWVNPGETPYYTEWGLADKPDWLGGTFVAFGAGYFSNTLYCLACGAGVADIYTSTVSGLNVTVPAGFYFLELLNGLTAQAGDEFWDQNNGPSFAYENTVGIIESEAFTVYGSATPEPGTILMLGSALVGAAGVLRRKMML